MNSYENLDELEEEVSEEELRYSEAIQRYRKHRRSKRFDECSLENIIEMERFLV